MRVLWITALGFALLGCGRADDSPKADPQPAASVTAAPRASAKAKATAPSPSAAAPAGPLVLARGLRMIKAAAGKDIPSLVREERENARARGGDLVVYVGATWCEPCKRFHAAAGRGDLDADFPTLTLLEFDAEEDRERLRAAGYVSEYIPLFVMPNEEGLASPKRFSGSVKGDGAVANIAPRLRALLAH